MKYLYNYKYLYPVGKAQEDVKELTLECYDIQPANRNIISGSQWSFKVVGRGSQVFHTSYSWALIENTPENLTTIEEFEEIHRQQDALQTKASRIYSKIKRFAVSV